MNSILSATVKPQTARVEGGRLAVVADASAVAVPAVFVLGTAALESVQSGYSRIADTVSALVWCQGGWLETLMFCLNGVFLLLFAVRLYRTTAGCPGKAGAGILALAGLSFLVLAACPTLAPGAEPTLRSEIHEVTARGLTAVFPLACLLLALGWRSVPEYRTLYRLTLGFGAAGLLLDCIGIAYVVGDLAWIGILERIIILNGFAWLAVLGLYLHHVRRAEAAVRGHNGEAEATYRPGLDPGELFGHLFPRHGVRVPVYVKGARTRREIPTRGKTR